MNCASPETNVESRPPKFWQRHPWLRCLRNGFAIVLLIVGLANIPGSYYPQALQTHPEIKPPQGSIVQSIYIANLWDRFSCAISSHFIFARFECDGDHLLLPEFEKPLLAQNWKKETISREQWMSDFLKESRGTQFDDDMNVYRKAIDALVGQGMPWRKAARMDVPELRTLLKGLPSMSDVQLYELQSVYFRLGSTTLGRVWGERLPYLLSHKDLEITRYCDKEPTDPGSHVEEIVCYAITFSEGSKTCLAVAADSWFNK